MASHKSALKRIEQNRKRAEQARQHRTRLRHQIRKLRVALESKDKGVAKAALVPTLALIDHSVSKGILHPNTAARYKSRLTLRFNALA